MDHLKEIFYKGQSRILWVKDFNPRHGLTSDAELEKKKNKPFLARPSLLILAECLHRVAAWHDEDIKTAEGPAWGYSVRRPFFAAEKYVIFCLWQAPNSESEIWATDAMSMPCKYWCWDGAALFVAVLPDGTVTLNIPPLAGMCN